jgi:hypothetical protein
LLDYIIWIDYNLKQTPPKSGSSSSHKEDGSGITDGSGPLSSRKHTRSVDLGNLDLNENQCAEETDCNPKSILSHSGEPLSTAVLATSDIKCASKAVGVSRGLKLDLNFSCGDEEDAIAASNVPPLWNLQRFNGNWSQPSSSKSSRQLPVRNFDLNDNMSIADGSVRRIDGSCVKTPPNDMSDHSAVTIMGKRIIAGHKDHVQQYEHNFLGPIAESRVLG